MQVRPEVYEAVKRGAAKLDGYYEHPAWRRACEGFDFSNPFDCILGKLFRGYMKGLDILEIPFGQAAYYGFDFDVNMIRDKNIHQEYQQAWQDEFDNPPLGTDDEPDTEICQALFKK